MASKPVILSIAGYDPSSGAGITADVKTAAAMGCYAVTCITALTVQSTQGVFGVEPVRPEVVRETLYRLAEDVDPGAVRIGMLGSAEVARVVAESHASRPACRAAWKPRDATSAARSKCASLSSASLSF